MEKLKNFGYVVRKYSNYDNESNKSIISVYNEKNPRVVLTRKRQYISSLDKYYVKYGLVTPYNDKEYTIGYDLGTKLFHDEDLLICFMEIVNRTYLDEEIKGFIGNFDDSKDKVKVLKYKNCA